jgi:Tol biopolymer transport system component/tRNA A-37 threonylcarbamoyl transferase component Bud32
MPLSPGSRLGPYDIVAPLGAGGMGVVYRAHDPRLAREVAIKALPASFATDADRLARFEREARLLASLQHPNVGGIFGLEDVEGSRYLVLEFLDGESLEARLKRGPLPLDEVLDVGRQVATGLEAAHESGIVHRDLKPGNIMLTRSGTVKLLDFGLARSDSPERSGSDPNLTTSPTMTHASTQPGVILGTAAYMSPEQARGKAVDRRTDIWSLGCVLYECLTGTPMHEGETVSDLVARILEREPTWTALPATTPPRLVALLRRCLTKDARQRQRDMGDVRLELEAIAAGETGQAPVAAASRERSLPVWAVAAIAAALVTLGGAGALLFAPRAAGERPATLTLLAPPGVAFGRAATDVVISPDGQQVVCVASDTLSGPRLWVRSVDRDNARPLVGTENAEEPFWSPDGDRVGFFANGKLKTVSVSNGAVRVLADAPLPRGGTWGGGRILYQPRSLGPLWSIPEEGGQPALASTVDSASGQIGHRFPQFLPDHRHFLVSVVGKQPLRKLFSSGGSAGAVFAPPGWLIAPRDGAVKAQRFDTRTFEVRGDPIEVPGLKALSPDANGSPTLSASATGTLLQRAAIDLPSRLTVVDRHGRTVSDIAGPVGTFQRGGMSPDGRHAALQYSREGGARAQVWVADLLRGGMQPYTFDSDNFTPVFSPDGRRIALAREVGKGGRDIWLMDADAPGSLRLVRHMTSRFHNVLGFTPDGRGLILRSQGTDTRQDLLYAPLSDSGEVRTLLATRFNEPVGAVSPDGRWLAYVSDESGNYECRVR